MIHMPMKPATPLKLAIVASGRQQQDIAAEVGLHPSRLSLIVNGLHTDDATRQAIARALGRNPDELWPPEPQERAA